MIRMQVNTQVADSLETFIKQFRTLTSKHFDELRPIGDAVMEIKPCQVEDRETFMRSLKTLSAAVITVRKEQRNSPSVRGLPVPPYDLFLPFKAVGIGSDNPEVLASVIKSFNEGMDQLKDHWSP